MARLCEGEDLALNALMERWEQPLLSFIHRYTSNHCDALDLAQETFVRIYENRGRYRPKGKFSTWMFTIAVNLCRNHARWKSRHPSISTVLETTSHGEKTRTGPVTDPVEQPDSRFIREEENRQIRDAVSRLPHDLRTAILLFEFEGMSHSEIANVLGCTPKAVETRLYRARQFLREVLSSLFGQQKGR